MDYHRTTEKYRRREMQSQVRFLWRAVLVVVAFSFGWLIGLAQTPDPVRQDQVTALTSDNNRLTQELALRNSELAREQQRRQQAELLAGSNSNNPVAWRAQQIVAQHISRGVSPERIAQNLQTLTPANTCRDIDQRDIEVVTPYFTGGERNRNFLSDSLMLFIEGEAQAATAGQSWYDITRPVMVRASYLGGEAVASGILPLTMRLPTQDWLIQIDLTTTDLNGYARVTISKCVFG